MKSLTELYDEFLQAETLCKQEDTAINILNYSLKSNSLIRAIQSNCEALKLEFDNVKLCRNREYREEMIKKLTEKEVV